MIGGEESAVKGAAMGVMHEVKNSGFDDSLSKTGISKVGFISKVGLFSIGSVAVGLASYIWINKKLKQMKDDSQAQMKEELQTQFMQLEQDVITNLNDTLNQTRTTEEKLTAVIAKKSADLDQKLQKTEERQAQNYVRLVHMQEELKSIQIKQQEQNVAQQQVLEKQQHVLKNLTCTFKKTQTTEEKLTALDKKLQKTEDSLAQMKEELRIV